MEATFTACDANTLKYRLTEGQASFSFEGFLRGLAGSSGFRLAFNAVLAAAPFEAFYWETPALSAGTWGRDFEFVLLKSKGLEGLLGQPQFFERHFAQGAGAVSFHNLGKDAKLIVPCQMAKNQDFPHLAAFVRKAPDAQVDDFWKLVGEECLSAVGTAPIWLNTAGMGVHWLHVRLDARPKYYKHLPYRNG